MPGKTRAWLLTTTAAALVAAVVVVLAYPLGAASGGSRELTVSAPASSEACTPCHPTLGSVRTDRLIFDHAAHLLTQCTACHTDPAHKNGEQAVPAMNTCFACHGLEHSPTGTLASGECADCHPEGFTLRPASHVEDWRDKPHADASAGGVNGCLMCHNAPTDCDVCHTEMGLDLPSIPAFYINTQPKLQAEPAVTVDLAGTVTISQCAYCHPNIDDFAVEGLVFGHGAHLQRAYRCESCHTSFPHGPSGTERIEMRSCMRCHGLEHNGTGTVASAECLKCHTAEFDLVPPDHTTPFLSGEHAQLATDDPAYCSQCHQPESCVACHNGGVPLADGRTSSPVLPENHLTPKWSEEHGGLYLEQKGMCVVCHTSEFCQRCHQTPMPHPATWITDHTEGNGSLAKDCVVCHTDNELCQECHHDSVRGLALLPENCVKCHEEMDTDEPTKIEVAGLAEHAVHFQVAEPDKRGEPYYCDQCHIGFGSSGVHVVNPATGPHDMRICYECHGALDFENTLIAPYAGAELCLRCHQDLL